MSADQILELDALIRTGSTVAGALALASLPDIGDRLQDGSGDVRWQASAARDGFGRPRLRLHLQTAPVVLCQRCLKPFSLPLDHHWQLGVVAREEDLPALDEEDDEVDFIVAGGSLAVADLLTEEILLALPMIALHDAAQCEGDGSSAPDTQAVAEVARMSPFARLQGLGKPPS